jgi:hypothetical protein
MYLKLAKGGRKHHSHGRLEEMMKIATDGRQSPITVLLCSHMSLLLHTVHGMKQLRSAVDRQPHVDWK